MATPQPLTKAPTPPPGSTAPMAVPRPGDITNGPFDNLTLPGYPRLANLMGFHGEIAIFRRFGALNALNLMDMQAELLDLEEELKDILLANEQSPKQVFAQDFYEMRNDTAGKELRDKMKEIRKLLKKYNAALLQASQVASLTPPHKADLHFLRRWLRGSRRGEGDSFLRGIERNTWHEKINIADFITVDQMSPEKDAATARLVDKLITWYNHFLGFRFKTPIKGTEMVEYSVATSAKYVLTVASSMLPALSILALYFEKELLKRIGIMIGMTTVFALVLTLFTSARRIEVFSATAAFAAVEVVFIGSTDVKTK